MKIIDLYVMVSNGKQPKKFKYKDRWFAYNVDEREFRSLEKEAFNGDYFNYIYLSEFIDLSNLNDEIEIIEEPKKIEKLEPIYKIEQDMNLDSVIAWQKVNNKIFQKKLDEIIEKINNME